MVSDQLKLSAIQVEVKSFASKDTCQSFSFDLGIVPFCGEKRAKNITNRVSTSTRIAMRKDRFLLAMHHRLELVAA